MWFLTTLKINYLHYKYPKNEKVLNMKESTVYTAGLQVSSMVEKN